LNKSTPYPPPFKSGGLKPIHEVYNGDDSDELGSEIDDLEIDADHTKQASFMLKESSPNLGGGFSLGMGPGMSKTFDISNPTQGKAVPKLDFRKLK
jgi:hypothetical protein